MSRSTVSTQQQQQQQQQQLTLQCLSCTESYYTTSAGTCKECYDEASETEEELKREIEDLKSKVAFLRFGSSPLDNNNNNNINNNNNNNNNNIKRTCSSLGFTDVVLVASDEFQSNPVSLPAHKVVLASRSPVFRAMLETEMKESRSGTINISDVSYDALRAFVNYLYTAEAPLDEQMACDLLVLGEKYEVKHLKTYCEKFLVSKLTWNNAVASYSFAHQHHAKHLLESALLMIIDNIANLTKSEEYAHLVEKDPRIVVEIYEAYMLKQVNGAARTN